MTCTSTGVRTYSIQFFPTDVGPLLVTENPQECIDFIDSLEPYGGGDCPELCNTGLEIAIINRSVRTLVTIIVFLSVSCHFYSGFFHPMLNEALLSSIPCLSNLQATFS